MTTHIAVLGVQLAVGLVAARFWLLRPFYRMLGDHERRIAALERWRANVDAR